MKSRWLSFLILLILLAACQPATEAPAATGTPSPALQSTWTPIITMQPTPTWASTLPPEQAEARVLELLNTNNGCNLPCFWGITPGQTHWADAKGFVEELTTLITQNNSSHDGDFVADFYLNDDNNANTYPMTISMYVSGDIVRQLRVSDFDHPSFSLAEFLTRNGKPDQLWLFSHQYSLSDHPNVVPFLLYL